MPLQSCVSVVVDFETEGKHISGRDRLVVGDLILIRLCTFLAFFPNKVIGSFSLERKRIDDKLAVVKVNYFFVFVTHI